MGSIFNRTVPLLGYIDDVKIVARSEKTMNETLIAFKIAAREFGLTDNESYEVKRVNTFVNLGYQMSSRNVVSQDITISTTWKAI